jgi:acyl carrier protein
MERRVRASRVCGQRDCDTQLSFVKCGWKESMTSQVEQRIFSMVRKMLPGAANLTITRDMDLLTDLNADSLSLVSLLFAMEEEFGLETSELSSLAIEGRTVGDLVAAIESRQ